VIIGNSRRSCLCHFSDTLLYAIFGKLVEPDNGAVKGAKYSVVGHLGRVAGCRAAANLKLRTTLTVARPLCDTRFA